MKFNINLTIDIDPDANFLEVDRKATLGNISEIIHDALYDIDDLEVVELDVTYDR